MGHYVQAVTVRWYNACAYYAVTLAQGLALGGHRVTVAAGTGTPALKTADEKGLDTLSVSGSASHDPIGYFRELRRLRSFALDNNVSLVNVHNGSDHLQWALALRGAGIPVVRTSGNQIPPKVHPGSRYLMKKTAGVITSCNTIREYYAEGFGIDRSRIHVIQGGVDSDFFSDDYPRNRLRKALGIPDDAFVFGIIGRFSPVKGHRYFFKAAGILASRRHGTWFVVSGWDAQLREAHIRAMASDAGVLKRTSFIGYQQDIRDLIGSLDAGVIASTGSETICRIAMEYMAMGVPVIAADTNVIPEIVRHGESGIVVPAGSHEALESAMEQLMTSGNGGKSLGQRGRKIIETEFSLESFASRTYDIYRGVTGG
ncbi:glycosyltransferase family 4 protein [bacterium]|nr:glycosyltransferase family 4 protein [bacterium]